MIDLRWNLHPFWNKETGKNTPMTAASTGARLTKALYDMLYVRVLCTVVGGWGRAWVL